MDKEEILKRGREDGPDEREQKIQCDAYSFAWNSRLRYMYYIYRIQYNM